MRVAAMKAGKRVLVAALPANRSCPRTPITFPCPFATCRELKQTLGELINTLKALHRVLADILDVPEDLAGLLLDADADEEGRQGYGDHALAGAGWARSPPALSPLLASEAAPSLPPSTLPQLTPAADMAERPQSPFAGADAPAAGDWAAGHYEGEGELEPAAGAAEVLLEAYLAQVDAVLTRAEGSLAELESAEQHGSLLLANSRNRLWLWQILLSAFNAVLNSLGVIGGYFGMNLGNAVKPGLADSPRAFMWIVAASSMAGVVLFMGVTVMVRWAIFPTRMRWRTGRDGARHLE
jgi:hypothetical protein